VAAQDVAELIPRVRRALEGPVELTGPDALTDDQVEALAADAIADIILLTIGAWPHTLEVSTRSDTGVPEHYTVTPELSLPEESVIAAQAAITYFFHQVKNLKVSESITNEGQTWDYTLSANLLRDQVKLLQTQRDDALAALTRAHPALARYASILSVRDRVGSALQEPWANGGLGGGQYLDAAPAW
jgi:hypothetical protein